MISFENYFDKKASSTTYHSIIEHFQDILSVTKLYIAIYEELAHLEASDQNQYAQMIANAWLHITSRENASSNAIYLPLIILKNDLSLSFYEHLCLILGLCTELDEGLCHTFSKLCGSPYPSFHLAMCFYGMTEEIDESIFASADLSHSSLQYVLTIEDFSDSPSLMRHSICLCKNVFLYLTDNLYIQDTYCDFFSFQETLSLASIYTDLQNKLTNYLASLLNHPTILPQAIVLNGPKGIGKKTLVKGICHHYAFNCILLDLDKLQNLSVSQLISYIKDLCFKLLFSNSFLILYHCQHQENLKNYSLLLKEIASISKVVFLCFDNGFSSIYYDDTFQFLVLTMPAPALPEKIILWDYMKEKYHLSIDAKDYASKYNLNFATLSTLLTSCELTARYSTGTQITNALLTQAILANSTEDKNTYIVNYPYTFDDLILEKGTLDNLHMICDYVKHRYTVFEQWGYSNKFPYGQGLSILFYGAPGTGKTMCASVLANEWGLTLLKVDLSQIVDKYIGETEKRLDTIFATAKENNCVLFFDEADALFSKRTDISSSNDKYANIEVSHLLQKLELYDGIIILATNLVQNFDEAFKRRINFMLRFNLPTADIRKELWKKAFPPEAPLSYDIDFDFLGEKYDLSPSIIKSTALYAAFLAASQNTRISMVQILESIKFEYDKNNRMLPQ